MAFGTLTDWFDLGSAGLEIVASQSNEGYKVYESSELCVVNGYLRATAVMNPVCTYNILYNHSREIILGKAYNNGSTQKYFITAVEVKTGAGQVPTLTVYGTANEGADAIKTHTLSISLNKRHRSANIGSAFSPSVFASVTSLTARWSAEPVVVVDGGTIVASDIQHGKFTAKATAPSALSVNSGFVITGTPTSQSDKAYGLVTTEALKYLT